MMGEYSRNDRSLMPLWRSKLMRAAVLAVGLLLIFLPATAQNRQSNNNTAGATLHISAVIVPTVMVPLPVGNQSQGAVTYNVPPRQMPLNTSTQIQPFREGTVLKTTIVVSR